MIKTVFLIASAFFCIHLQGQSAHLKVDSLLQSQQYLTAYEYILANEKDWDAVEVLLLKSQMAINYYTSSRYHRFFGFDDLRPGESLQLLRTRRGQSDAGFPLRLDSLLLATINNHPNDYRLNMQLGKYYHEVFLLFGDRWGEKSEWLLEQSKSNYEVAYRNAVYDYQSLYFLGYYHTLTENYHEARHWYKKSLSLKNDALTNYNLAVACLFDGMFGEGVEPAKQAYQLFADSLKKADAARITGILLSKQELNESALVYFQYANRLAPGYKPNQLYLLKTLLALDRVEEAANLAEEILYQFVYDPDIAEEFLDLFAQTGYTSQLADLFKKAVKDHKGDDEATGNVYFHFAKLEYKRGHSGKAKRYLKLSRKHFMQVFDSGHQVFQAIDQMLYQL